MINACDRIDLRVYEEMIGGKFRPHLPKFEEKESWDDLVRKVQHQKIFSINTNESVANALNAMDLSLYGYKDEGHYKIEMNENQKSGKKEIFIYPIKKYSFLEPYDIPTFSSDKVSSFVEMILDEFERIKIRANRMLETFQDQQKLVLYVKRYIQKAKKLLHDGKVLMKSLQNKEYIESYYIIFVLCTMLIRVIVFYQKHFNEFVQVKEVSEKKLLSELQKTTEGNWELLFIKAHSEDSKKSLLVFTDVTEASQQQRLDRQRKTFFNHTGDLQNQSNIKASGKDKLKWNGQINVLVDVFIQLSEARNPDGTNVLEVSNEELGDFLLNSFSDKDGNPLSYYTINTLLKPSRTDKRLKNDSPKRIDLSGHFE